MRPTRTALWPLVGAAVLYGLAGQTGAGWLALGAMLSLAVPAVALLQRPRLGAVAVTAEPVHSRLGAPATDRLVLANTGSRTTPDLTLVDDTALLGRVVVAIPALAPGTQVTVVVERSPACRGWSPARAVELSSAAPWGMVRARRMVDLVAPVVVAPRRIPIAPGSRAGAGTGGTPSALAGLGTEVLGLRPWRPGDGAAAVSARATARHGRPVVLERESERGSRLVVVCTGPGRGPAWEAAIERSCAVVEQALAQGRTPVLLAAGLHHPGRADLRDALQWHAAVDGSLPLDASTAAAVRRAVGPSGAVVVLGQPSALLHGLTVVPL